MNRDELKIRRMAYETKVMEKMFDIRTETGYTADELDKILKQSKSTWQRIESGDRGISIVFLLDMMKHFDLNISELLGE
tara:strand:- start:729 stop:965 length:237 start_codon:yes stop_codon:yes gene_type:complete